MTTPESLGFSSELHPVVEHYGNWAVTTFGVERIDGNYPIPVKDLHESDWVDHIRGKRSRLEWDVRGFSRALRAARKFHGVTAGFRVSRRRATA